MIRRRRNDKGFTMAEMLMAVAIILILAGVAFIGVARYLRSMALLERDGIAKEIFIAAQNHLTAAKGQGYLGVTEYGNSVSESATEESVYYICGTDSMAEVMLPAGSIDETVRATKNYIIRYQPSTAKVLDVFYCSTSGRFKYTLSSSDYDYIISQDYTDKGFRRDSFYDGSSVLGWFGGEKVDTLEKSTLEAPTLELINDDVLYAVVKNPNTSGKIQVFVEGVSSGVYGYFEYSGSGSEIKVVFDDVTKEENLFSNLKNRLKNRPNQFYPNGDVKDFIPGEDIRVYAKVIDTEHLAPVKRTDTQTTNSLFDSIDAETTITDDKVTDNYTITDNYTKAYIKNFRHLENLNDTNSGLVQGATTTSSTGSTTYETTFNITNAVQLKDLIWDAPETGGSGADEFVDHIIALGLSGYSESNKTSVYDKKKDKNTEQGCYLPVSPSYQLNYDGAGFHISWLKVNYEDDAGLIGSMSGGSVSNLALVNCDITSSSGNAGALAGSLTAEGTSWHTTDVTNVIAYNTDTSMTSNITTSSSSTAAGGLIGLLKGNNQSVDYGDVDACAAAVYVTGAGDAGGLIGKVEGPVTVQRSYAGGHVIDENGSAVYSTNTNSEDAASKGLVNVIGSGNVGGLVGNVSSPVGESDKTVLIKQSYSTCSAYGTTRESAVAVGGLAGYSANVTFNACYATGWVSGAADTSTDAGSDSTIKTLASIGAFAGSSTGSSMTGCYYFSIINESLSDTVGAQYLSAVGGDAEDPTGITALDETAATYDGFSGAKTNWKEAVPYNSLLNTYYGGLYNLKTVYQLAGTSSVPAAESEYFVQKHHGDWPAPETFVINTAGGGAAGG